MRVEGNKQNEGIYLAFIKVAQQINERERASNETNDECNHGTVLEQNKEAI